ncbi:MAG: S-layer homology domain-containing protein [Chloroflexota bacterium]
MPVVIMTRPNGGVPSGPKFRRTFLLLLLVSLALIVWGVPGWGSAAQAWTVARPSADIAAHARVSIGFSDNNQTSISNSGGSKQTEVGSMPAQSAPGDDKWAPGFGALGADGIVYAIAVSGTDVYIGGRFNAVGDTAAANIAHWDGTGWHPLGAGVNNTVYAIAVTGSDVYVGGAFTSAGGVYIAQVARWDGSQWNGLGSGVGNHIDPAIRAITVVGTDVYVAGVFTAIGNVTTTGVARWDGASWYAMGGGLSDNAYALAAGPGGVFVGGKFTSAYQTGGGSVPAQRVARWDGTAWSGLGAGIGGSAEESVLSLAMVGSSLYAGGTYQTAGGTPAGNVARWDGAAWHPLGSGTDNSVSVLVDDGLGSVLVGGAFASAGGQAIPLLARWNGSTWSAVALPIDGSSPQVYAVAPAGSGLFVGGAFGKVGDLSVSCIALWDGSMWHRLATGNGSVGLGAMAVAVSDYTGDVYVGGRFMTANNQVTNNIARWDGAAWHSIGSGLDGSVGPLVRSIVVSGTEVYAGGFFTGTGGVPLGRVAHWSGTYWDDMGGGVSGGGPQYLGPLVSAIAISGTDVYVGGDFLQAGGLTVNSIARWDGTRWHSLGTGVQGAVRSISISGDDLYVGGGFTTAGGVPANNIARWDGSGWHPVGQGTDDSVFTTVVSGTNLYAGGIFRSVYDPDGTSVPASCVARWDSVGGHWNVMGDQTNYFGFTGSLAVSGNRVYAGGVATNGLLQYDGSTWTPLGSGVNSTLDGMAINAAGRLFVVGNFTITGDKGAVHFGAWQGPCTGAFNDVPPASPFYSYVSNLVSRGVVSGYPDCDFRVSSQVTRGQLAKIVSLSAGFNEPASGQSFEDVPPASTFYDYIERLSARQVMSGYACGGPGEPCGAGNRPYFRPGSTATRGQLTKIVSNAAGFSGTPAPGQYTFTDVPEGSTFHLYVERLIQNRPGVMGGYACGGVGEPCDAQSRPYFRPGSNVTRGQTSKIVSSTFFP